MPTCTRCNYEWRTRTDAAPKACPNCRSRSWNIPAGRKGEYCLECPHCNALKPIPSRGPKTENQTALDRFNTLTIPDEPRTATCPKCSHEWQSRTDAPKQCPRCKARLDAGAGAKADQHAKNCAARALAALGPITADLGSYDGAVCDLPGRILGWVKPALVFRGTLDAEDRAVHYPVFSGPTSDGEYNLCGWIRTDAPFERRS